MAGPRSSGQVGTHTIVGFADRGNWYRPMPPLVFGYSVKVSRSMGVVRMSGPYR